MDSQQSAERVKGDGLRGSHRRPSAWRRVLVILKVARRHGLSRSAVRSVFARGEASEATGATAARIREALIELGPTFVKFGQMLAQRQDLFPEAALEEFRLLEDAVEPIPVGLVRQIIQEEFGKPVEELFIAFDDDPMGAASIAQVHRATLVDGTGVAVKVQRPGLHAIVEADLNLMLRLAASAERWAKTAHALRPVELVTEFAESLRRELDFRNEAGAAAEIASGLRDDPGLVIPKVIRSLTSGRVMTSTLSPGRKLAGDWPITPELRRLVADRLVQLYLRQALELGIFHADLHRGNVFADADGRLCMHDFGIVGRLRPTERKHFQGLLLALLARDARWMVEIYREMGVIEEGIERSAFEKDLTDAIGRFLDDATRRSSIGEILVEFLGLSQRYGVRAPRGVLLVSRGFMQVEAQTGRLVPGYDVRQTLGTYAANMVARQLVSPVNLFGSAIHGYRAWLVATRLGASIPAAIDAIAAQIANGTFVVQVKSDEMRAAAQQLGQVSNRLAVAVIFAAFVVAAALALTAHGEVHWREVPALVWVGFGLAGVVAAGWAWSSWRTPSPRRPRKL